MISPGAVASPRLDLEYSAPRQDDGQQASLHPTNGASTVRFQTSINRRWPAQKLGLPPAEKRWARYNSSFKAEEYTPASLLEQVAHGYSFTAVLGGCQGACCGFWCTKPEHRAIPGHCGRPHGYRANRHFESAQIIASDFDTGDARSTFDYLLGIPLIAGHSTFLYTTLSHTPQHPKARVVFITDEPFTDAAQYRRTQLALMDQFPWGDASVHDPSRLFYGTHPREGMTHYQGNILPLAVVDELIEEYRSRLEAEQERRVLPRMPSSKLMGSTPAERYVNAAVQAEAAWLSSQVEGTGERLRGLLIAAMKLASLRLSEWLPDDVRATIDPYAALLPAAVANGYIAKYGETMAYRTIADGIAYATPRGAPDSHNPSWPRLSWSGGRWVKAVRA
jgi:hypothetical protein